MDLNIWKMIWRRKWYFVRHPFSWFHDIITKIKWAHQRITRGYADTDWYELCYWMIGVLAPMLEDFSDHHCGHPIGEDGFTEESWSAYLKDIARHIRNASEDQSEQINEYGVFWDKTLGEIHKHKNVYIDNDGVIHHVIPDLTEEQDIIKQKYYQREIEIYKWRCKEIQTAFKMIGDHFFDLWD